MKYIKKYESVTGQDLILAVRKGNLNRVEDIIKSGVDLDERENTGTKFDVMRYNALLYASEKSSFGDSVKIVKVLVDAGSNLNVQDVNGYTPLMKANEK